MKRKKYCITVIRSSFMLSIFFIFFSGIVVGQTHQLLFFTGSDWCMNCMVLEKQILSNEKFTQFVEPNFVVMQIDFPQKKKQTKEEIERNEAMAEKYNKAGVFPLILVIKDGKTITLPFHRQDADEFIDELKNILSSHE